MHLHKHYSFDVWGTLIYRNDEYRQAREEYFKRFFMRKGRTLESGELDKMMIDVWNYFDQRSKLFGHAPNPLEMYAMVIFRITGKLDGISMLEMHSLYADLERLFLTHPPYLFSDTKEVLEELKNRGRTLSILSNTSYIKGSTITKALEIREISDLFKFQLYSDEVGYSKPHEKFFKKIEVYLREDDIDNTEIIHVGDKELEDAQGAHDAGFDYFVINSNSYTIKDLL